MARPKAKSQGSKRRSAQPELAFLDADFLTSPDARGLRILAEYTEPAARFEAENVRDTIVFFGSARIKPRAEGERELEQAIAARSGIGAARQRLRSSRYYEDTRELARRLTEWSKGLPGGRRFVVCTGGGPGIMEAANRGAADAKGINIGLNIALPFEQDPNPYSTRRLTFQFHYFFMRKFWFAYFAKAMVFMPGGFGTLDELAEVLTLCQTFKLKKRMPMVLFGTGFWRRFFDLNALVQAGTISRSDLDLLYRTDSVDDAFEFITSQLSEAIDQPGGTLQHARDVSTSQQVSRR
jgi:uncharacterized protein (TIGR00730 family)